MNVRAYIITGSGTALIVPDPMPDCVVLNDEAKEIKANADHQRVFDLNKDSALCLDKEAAQEHLKISNYYISHIPPMAREDFHRMGN